MVGPYGGAPRRHVDASTPHDGGTRMKLKFKRSMVALLAALLVFSSTPAQLWAEGAEGIAQAVAAVDTASSAEKTVADDASKEQAASADEDEADKADAGEQEKAAAEDATSDDASDEKTTDATGEQAASEEAAAEKTENTATDEATDPTDQQVAAAADRKTVEVSIKVIGPNADGENVTWASNANASVPEGSMASALSEQLFKDAGIDADYGEGSFGWYLNTITSPYTDEALGWDTATKKYWQLFVNGEPSGVGAGQAELKAGDKIVWFYSASGESLPSDDEDVTPSIISTIEVIGADAAGNAQRWAAARAYVVPEGTTAAQLSEELFKDADIDANYVSGEWWYLETITSPYTGEKLGYDYKTDKFWQLFVNGKSSSVGAGQVKLKDGDSILWCYSAFGDSAPSDGDLVVDPTAPRPSDTASWAGFGNGGSTVLENVATPTESAAAQWTQSLGSESNPYVSIGDPIIVGDSLYVTTNTDLIKIDRATGTIQKRIKTGGNTRYFSRPVYADGLIIVPSDDGSVAAFTADGLVCVWKTPALEKSKNGNYQANSTLTVANGCVYVPYVAGVGNSGTASAGALVCIRISDGKVLWTNTTVKEGTSTGEGYYWAGAAVSGSDLVIGDEGGRVSLINGATGKTVSSVRVGIPCRATVVSAGTQDGKQVFLAVGREPATLYKIVREGDALKVVGAVKFAASSTVTPAVVGGKVYVAGSTVAQKGEYQGILATVDLATMKLESTYAADATIQSTPLVSVQGGDTYVYFTCNAEPGALFRYTQSTHAVEQIYTPAEDAQSWCTASVIADAQGNLYYSNDSGTIFAIKAVANHKVSFDGNGGSAVSSTAVAPGAKLTEPQAPVREGYTFKGWYTADGKRWDFNTPVTADLVLTARWEKVEKPAPANPGTTTTTPAGKGPQGTKPTATTLVGKVFPAMKPLAQQTSAKQDEKADESADEETTVESATKESTSSKAKSSAKKASAAKAVAEPTTGIPVGVVAGVVGVVGVVIAAAWLATLKRRG